MCEVETFLVAMQCRVSAGLVMLRKYTPVEFTFIKNRAMTISRSPQCWASSRALMDEKSSPLFPVGSWGEVVTNDWCIIASTTAATAQLLPSDVTTSFAASTATTIIITIILNYHYNFS